MAQTCNYVGLAKYGFLLKKLAKTFKATISFVMCPQIFLLNILEKKIIWEMIAAVHRAFR